MRLVSILLLCLLVGASSGQLGYVERPNGLRPPNWEGGRTELEFADINNDGNVDILSIGDHGSPYVNTDEHGVMVWFGDGRGNWSVYQYGEFGYGGIAVGDVNWDGHWDVGYGMHHNYASGDLGDDMLEVALGDGTGRMWTAWDDGLIPGGTVWGMFTTDFADVDNDGDLDIGSCSFGSGVGLRVFLNNRDGTWTQSFGLVGNRINSTMEFRFCDVNGDGNADIVAGTAGPPVYFGDGTGNFVDGSTGLPRSDYGLNGISAGDIDNDGCCEVVYATSSGGIEVWDYNLGLGRWQNISTGLPTAGALRAARICDMNGDGYGDVVALGGGTTTVWLGNGGASWTQAATITTPSPGTYAALVTGWDFDHNGRPDIAFVTREGSWPSDYNVLHVFAETTSATALSIRPVFPRGREKFAAGSVQFVDWWSSRPDTARAWVKLELSTTGDSGPWTVIAESLPDGGRFQWLVPLAVVSPNCYIRYTLLRSTDSATAITPQPFAIGDTMTAVAEPSTAGDQQRSSTGWALVYDATGRWVGRADATPNASRLRPGVYFSVSPASGRTAKVVVLR